MSELPRSTPPAHPLGVNEALSHVRLYTDEPALDRVWNRLETRRRRSAGLGPVSRVALAAALVTGGMFLGMFVERQQAAPLATELVASEVVQGLGVPSGPSESRQRFAAPRRLTPEKKAQKARARRTVSRLSAPVSKIAQIETGVSAEGLDEELIVPEVEEVVVAPKATWLVLAERGEFAASFQQVDGSGGFDAILATGSSEELMTLVEVARFVGRQGRAVQALRAVTTRHQDDPNAPIAAMILGNLLSRSGDATGAAQAYALNRRLSPGGDFAEDALVGEFDMAVAGGDLATVERLRTQYESEFPEGRHLKDIRTESERLAARTPASTAADSGKSASASDSEGDQPAERSEQTPTDKVVGPAPGSDLPVGD